MNSFDDISSIESEYPFGWKRVDGSLRGTCEDRDGTLVEFSVMPCKEREWSVDYRYTSNPRWYPAGSSSSLEHILAVATYEYAGFVSPRWKAVARTAAQYAAARLRGARDDDAEDYDVDVYAGPLVLTFEINSVWYPDDTPIIVTTTYKGEHILEGLIETGIYEGKESDGVEKALKDALEILEERNGEMSRTISRIKNSIA